MNKDYVYTPIEEGTDPFDSGFDHSGVDSGEFDDSLDYEDKDLCLGFVRYVALKVKALTYTN